MKTFKEFITELSKKTLGSYVQKSARDMIDKATLSGLKYNRKGHGGNGDKEAEKTFKRYHGIERATKKLMTKK